MVGANATASGASVTNFASAQAVGLVNAQRAADRVSNLDVTNTATFQVNATANGDAGSATATATGMRFNSAGITGTVVNTATMNVTASAPGGSANAFGVIFNADVFTGSFTNTGSLVVSAIGSTTATGIRVGTSAIFTNTLVFPVGGEEGTLTNDSGLLWAGVSSDGVNFTHGTLLAGLSSSCAWLCRDRAAPEARPPRAQGPHQWSGLGWL